LYDENGKMRGEMKTLHALLKDSGKTAEECKPLAEKLVKLEEKSKSHWAIIDKWWEESQTGEKKPDIGDTVKKVENYKKYIGRNINSEAPDVQLKVKLRLAELKEMGIDWEPKK